MTGDAQKVLFDTNILIDYLAGVAQARTTVEIWGNEYICPITWMEVMVGTTRETEAATRDFLASFTMLPLNPDIYEQAVIVRKRYGIKLPDALIRATARVHGCLLITRNTRDFPLSEPDIHVPYML